MCDFAVFESCLDRFVPATMIESLRADGSGLRAAFVRLADRFAHAVAWLPPADAAEPRRWMLVSLEGSPGDGLDWPPSPPLQDLSIEHRGSSSVALAVGMAGKSHWSFSAEAIAGSGSIAFDIACRIGGEPRLGSRYHPADDLEIMARLEQRTIEIELGSRRFVLQVELGEAPNLGFEDVSLGAAVPAGAKSARWKYVMRIED